MKLIYSFRELKELHGLSNLDTLQEEDVTVLSQYYNVIPQTVLNWHKNNKVPVKYIKCLQK